MPMLTHLREVASRATRAAKRLLATLHPQGGWRASGDAALDTRASAWGAHALLSAKEAGLIELEDELERIAGALTEHNAQPVMSTQRALTHELVARVLAGESPGSENDVLRRAELALAAPNPWRADGEGVDPELRYLQSFLAYQLGRNLNYREFRERDGVFDAKVSQLSGTLPDQETR